MSENQWTKVDDYFVGLFLPTDTALDAALRRSADGATSLRSAWRRIKANFWNYSPRMHGFTTNSGDWHSRRLQHHLVGARPS